ncbi:MAG: carbamoyltransferase HypF [Limisphaerales bacterium]
MNAGPGSDFAAVLPADYGQTARLRLVIRGGVQGVGFRPFLYRLARELDLAGWVSNSAQGVVVEIEGTPARVRQFLVRVEPERPAPSFIQSLEPVWLAPAGLGPFAIRPSAEAGARTALILPDIATCPECLREVFDPRNRRYQHPFTNCTHCGPRFSLIESLPYDRANTAMKGFALCPRCLAEYEDPGDRRFHAQPNACPDCGPHLELWDRSGAILKTHGDALATIADALRDGAIVAVKGVGGFHLMCLAADDRAVGELRNRKQREAKPLALMAPSLAAIESLCHVDDLEARLLRSAEAPIVLLRRRSDSIDSLSTAIAPGNPYLGVMLPYSPLHHLLLDRVGRPLVATSGNLADEPICIDELEVRQRLGGIADLFLVHNRPILRHVDDSIVRVVLDREMVLRRARGYAPLPVGVEMDLVPTLALGAHLKNTLAYGRGREVFLSQHIGDLDTAPALHAFDRVREDLARLLDVVPVLVAGDLHPGYGSNRQARMSGTPMTGIQHHYAHVLAGMVENQLAPPVLGIAWDGTGHGLDETIWGGEFLLIDDEGFERVGHLRPFRLPGGESAIKEPRRAALGLLYALLGEEAFERMDLAPLRAFSPTERQPLQQMLRRGLHSPFTSSAGRLFDAVASLLDLRQWSQFEGQAAMDLEFALDGCEERGAYPFPLVDVELDSEPRPVRGLREAASTVPAFPSTPPRFHADWQPMLEALLLDLAAGVAQTTCAARFHQALAGVIVAAARKCGQHHVVLSGGCFQNRYLIERTVQQLKSHGFYACWPQRVPPNDGGLALGQVIAAQRAVRKGPR